MMSRVMEEEVRHLAGERHEQHEGRLAHRWGKEDGYSVVDGQKVPIKRTRLRNTENREQRLGSYDIFQRSGPLQKAVWDKMMRGLWTWNYGAVVKEFQQAYGVEKSAVSENFIEASRAKVKALMERPLGQLRLCAVLIRDTRALRSRQSAHPSDLGKLPISILNASLAQAWKWARAAPRVSVAPSEGAIFAPHLSLVFRRAFLFPSSLAERPLP